MIIKFNYMTNSDIISRLLTGLGILFCSIAHKKTSSSFKKPKSKFPTMIIRTVDGHFFPTALSACSLGIYQSRAPLSWFERTEASVLDF